VTFELERLRAEVARARLADPSAGARMGAVNLIHRIQGVITGPQGVNADLLLAILGSLAGRTAQAAAIEIARAGQVPIRADGIMVIATDDGATYYYGNTINATLFESSASILALTGTFARAGGMDLGPPPDIDEIARHVAGTLGRPQFGAIRWPVGRGDPNFPTPVAMVHHFWPGWRPYLDVFCSKPNEWLILMACAIYDTLSRTAAVMPPSTGLRIVMEAAVPMSKAVLGYGPRVIPTPGGIVIADLQTPN
jgi:hypothetical protein